MSGDPFAQCILYGILALKIPGIPGYIYISSQYIKPNRLKYSCDALLRIKIENENAKGTLD